MMRSNRFSTAIDQMEQGCWYTIGSLCLLGHCDSDALFFRFGQILESISLGRTLLRMGVLGQDELLKAIKESLAKRESILKVLLRGGCCTRQQVREALGEMKGAA